MDRLAELRESQGLTLRDLAERSGVDANTINQVELGHRKPRPSTLRKLAKALDVEVADFFREPAVPLDEALAPPGPSERSALTDEWSLRLLAPIALAATALNALFKPKVDNNDITIEGYEQVGEAFVRLDRQMADAVSKYSLSGEGVSGAPEAVREAFNQAWVTMDELRYTLQRAYEELKRREEAGVPDLDEFRRRTA